MIIKNNVEKELQFQSLLLAMENYLKAIRLQSYLPADERIKGLEEVRKSLPIAFRLLTYLKTKELESPK